MGLALWVWLRESPDPPRPAEGGAPSAPRHVDSFARDLEAEVGGDGGGASGAGSDREPSEIERHKVIDRAHLRAIHGALFAYRERHGHFPGFLSELAPEFLDLEMLVSPRSRDDGMNRFVAMDHPDPGLETPGYGYEFSNIEFRDGRTFAEIKDIQRTEWGDAIPLLRAFGYDKVINMAYGGVIYETELNWEWDPATLDVVDELGWGPGLAAGEFVDVHVTDTDGRPLRNAEVWASGREYSFDLPERPFVTDADGLARIPIAVDLDRTALGLRVETPGLASTAVRFPMGSPPQSHTLVAEAPRQVGGRVVDSDGNPIAGTRVYLRSATGGDGTASLGVVKTNVSGRWTANVHPSEADSLHAIVPGGPGSQSGTPPQLSPGTRLNPGEAVRGTATIVVGGD